MDPDKKFSETELESPSALDDGNNQLKRAYRRMDRRIIPCLWVLYFLASASRSNVGLALTMNLSTRDGLGQRLGLSGHQISTGVALFYVAYVIFEVPSNLVMSRIRPHVWIARIQMSIGIVAACHAALNSVWSFYLLRFLLGACEAGVWPGMTYYLTLWYPTSRIAHRIGWYFTAAQLSAAVVGLVSAGFQKMNRSGGLRGYAWMFLIYGIITFIDGVITLWWLPDRPSPIPEKSRWWSFVPTQKPLLSPTEAEQHKHDMKINNTSTSYHRWTFRDLLMVIIDWRVWPVVIMYFGVVGVGVGIQNYGSLIIAAINPKFTSIQLSLLFAPIWLFDAAGILLITPFSDRYPNHRAQFFSGCCIIIIAGLLVTTLAGPAWGRYSGLLIVGFGLGPTVPICMCWSAELFGPRHGEVGIAAASAIVSGLGNLGSVTTTYALYTGWPSDKGFRKSNFVAVGLVGISILAAMVEVTLLRLTKSRS